MASLWGVQGMLYWGTNDWIKRGTSTYRDPYKNTVSYFRSTFVANGLVDTNFVAVEKTDKGTGKQATYDGPTLTDVLGLPWDRVHDEAMRLEHSLTPEAEARLESLLNHPETCPHGAPIPVPDTSPPPPATRTLDRVVAGTQVRIEQVTEEDGALLRYLASLGLFPQARLTVEEVAPFGGPLLVQVNGARYAIGRDVAAKILVGK